MRLKKLQDKRAAYGAGRTHESSDARQQGAIGKCLIRLESQNRQPTKKSLKTSSEQEDKERQHRCTISAKTVRLFESLGFPHELRQHLYVLQDQVWIDFSDIVDFTAAQISPSKPTSLPRDTSSLEVIVDMDTNMSSATTHLDILPFLQISFAHQHILFRFGTSIDGIGSLLCNIMSQVFTKRAKAWRKLISDSNCITEVNLWFADRWVDIVLKPGSAFAVEFDLTEENAELKSSLGQLGLERKGGWRGTIAVKSIE